MNKRITEAIAQSIAAKQAILEDISILEKIDEAVVSLVDTFRANGKVLFCGNGGSAADAQHLAAELSGRFYFDRPPLFAEALHVNTSFLTAVANDYSFDAIYERMLMAAGKKGDILFALSTSGNSPNVVRAIKAARGLGLKVIGLTGSKGGKVNNLCDIHFKVPSDDTPRIQECHMLIGHIICELVEATMFEQ